MVRERIWGIIIEKMWGDLISLLPCSPHKLCHEYYINKPLMVYWHSRKLSDSLLIPRPYILWLLCKQPIINSCSYEFTNFLCVYRNPPPSLVQINWYIHETSACRAGTHTLLHSSSRRQILSEKYGPLDKVSPKKVSDFGPNEKIHKHYCFFKAEFFSEKSLDSVVMGKHFGEILY